jgi:hypothetical protein
MSCSQTLPAPRHAGHGEQHRSLQLGAESLLISPPGFTMLAGFISTMQIRAYGNASLQNSGRAT